MDYAVEDFSAIHHKGVGQELHFISPTVLQLIDQYDGSRIYWIWQWWIEFTWMFGSLSFCCSYCSVSVSVLVSLVALRLLGVSIVCFGLFFLCYCVLGCPSLVFLLRLWRILNQKKTNDRMVL